MDWVRGRSRSEGALLDPGWVSIRRTVRGIIIAASRQSSRYLDLHEPQAKGIVIKKRPRCRPFINWSKSMPTHQYITMAEQCEKCYPSQDRPIPGHLVEIFWPLWNSFCRPHAMPLCSRLLCCQCMVSLLLMHELCVEFPAQVTCKKVQALNDINFSAT